MKLPDGKQGGIVLLLLLLVFLVTGATLVLGSLNSSQAMYAQQQAELSNQMRSAKEALMAFAANSSAIHGSQRGPGFFPCPDTTNTGAADSACSSTMVNLGRLPQYATGMDDDKIFFNSYYANAGRQFWYAVAPAYIYSGDPSTIKAINRTSRQDISITSSRLTVDTTDNIVAVILAPGEGLGFQNRDAAPLAPSNFLEGGNEDNDRSFFTTASNLSAFNDQMIAITHDELMAYIGSNVSIEIKRLLDIYYEIQPGLKHYPGNHADPPASYQAEFADVLANHAWLGAGGARTEQWAANATYTLNSPVEASLVFTGCERMKFILDRNRGVSRNGNSC